METISPQVQFPIVRKLADPSDSATYFVRAYIRDSITGAIIDTVNLADGGNQRFTRVITAPSDISGLGRYVDITTKVFTDSGYTTQNSPYSDEVTNYLIAIRWNPSLGSGGGAGMGPDISYKKIESIVENKIEEAFRKNKPNDPEKVELSQIEKGIDVIVSMIDGLPKKSTDLQPVSKQITKLTDLVKSLPQFKETNLSPILDALTAFSNDFKSALSTALDGVNADLKDQVIEAFTKTQLGQHLNDLNSAIEKVQKANFTFSVQPLEEGKEVETKAPGGHFNPRAKALME